MMFALVHLKKMHTFCASNILLGKVINNSNFIVIGKNKNIRISAFYGIVVNLTDIFVIKVS